MPTSDAVRRAIKETEKALRELGYNVVPFFLTDEVWDLGRELEMAMTANGIISDLMEEVKDECDSI